MKTFIDRDYLLQQMSEQESQSVDCANCQGECCTYIMNSMMIDPVEAFEIYAYLKQNNLINEQLITALNQTIEKYRLDRDMPGLKRTTLRRSYTCTFYTQGPKGCSLPRAHKPLGCLAFNPTEKSSQDSTHCSSQTILLEKQMKLNSNLHKLTLKQLNLCKEINWQKLPIPLAVKYFIDHQKEFPLAHLIVV